MIEDGKVAVSLVQPEKDWEPIDDRALQLLKLAIVSKEQFWKAPSPIVVMELLEGIVTVDRLEHPLNAFVPMVVRGLGRVTDRRFVHVPFAPN